MIVIYEAWIIKGQALMDTPATDLYLILLTVHVLYRRKWDKNLIPGKWSPPFTEVSIHF